MDWYSLPEPENQWLVKGLLTSDDYAGFVGKPKSGKSTSIRALSAAVVNGGQFLGRDILLPPKTGRVLYIHLDRKDPVHAVAKELRQLGIKSEDKGRLRLHSSKQVPSTTNEARLEWLADEVTDFQPHLIVIDLLAHFLRTKKGINDYDGMVEAIATLQDKLTSIRYGGVVIVSLHGRKAVSEDVGDNILGSTGIRGSLSTCLYFKCYRKQKTYTVQSDQTFRDPAFGELDETIVNRDAATGALSLGARYEEVKHEAKKDEWEVRRQKVLSYIQRNAGTTLDDIEKALKMSGATVLSIIEALTQHNFIHCKGAGRKGDPKKYFPITVTAGPVGKKPKSEELPASKPSRSREWYVAEIEDTKRLRSNAEKSLIKYPSPEAGWAETIAKYDAEIAELQEGLKSLEQEAICTTN